MKPGDLVRIAGVNVGSKFYHRREGLKGLIVKDLTPGHRPGALHVFDVMWNNGTIEDLSGGDLEVINESR